ncbi:hypothetical protein RCL1_007441 [Eukaryota sp. TZLM3-RCL]
MTCSFYVKTPARVNIIGEHVDYEHFPVLPMAITKYFEAWSSPSSSHLVKISIDSLLFQIDLTDPNVLSDKPIHQQILSPNLSVYAICALKGLLHFIKPKELNLQGLVVNCRSNIPQAAGLSSSSAIVVTFLLLFNQIYSSNPLNDRIKLADVAIRCEQFCGTLSGGMDQTVILNAVRDASLLINFSPLCFHVAPLPRVSFVVAHSLEQSHKVQTKDLCYNYRVVECKIACCLIAKTAGKNGDKMFENLVLRDLFHSLNIFKLDKMIDFVVKNLPRNALSLVELSRILNCSLDSIIDKVINNGISTSNFNDLLFYPYNRALHVLTEARRVHEFMKQSSEGNLIEMGNLMNESHASLRDLYNCSTPSLDELSSLCLANGALGSRLTGAGWGGMTISLVRSEDVNKLIDALWNSFYVARGIDESQRESVLFLVESSDCATITRM